MQSLTPLSIMRLPGPGTLWKLQQDLIYKEEGIRIHVPAGFISDGNSSPLKFSERESAGWVHDLLYRTDGFNWVTPRVYYNRHWADYMYRRVAKVDGANTWGTLVDFAVLRLIGSRSWQKKDVGVQR